MKKIVLVLVLLALVLTLTACKCKHAETMLLNAAENSCTSEGYTGDVVCVKCEETVTAGSVVPAAGHTEGEAEGVIDATCVIEGYTGDVSCETCGEMLVKGEVVPMTEHIPGDLINVLEPTCTELGYTGDTRCTVCDAWTSRGSSVPELGHTPGEPINAAEATCTEKGYTGDAVCTVCEADIWGEVIERAPHSMVNNVCSVCGMPEPGLYIADSLQLTWADLTSAGHVTVKDGVLRSASKGIHGVLVIDDEVTEINSKAFEKTDLAGVHIPASCMEIGYMAFSYCENLEEVTFYGELNELGNGMFQGSSALKSIVIPEGVDAVNEYAFKDCAALETVVLPEGIVEIGNRAFDGCVSLREINTPASLEEIWGEAFKNCTALTAFELPEGLRTLGGTVFNGSGVSSLTLPSTLTEIGNQEKNDTLVHIDMSKAALSKFNYGATVADCAALESIVLPDTLVELRVSCIRRCPKLQTLVLPDKLMTINYYEGELSGMDSLESVVWPVTLSDGGCFADCENLKTIYYRGSEVQWSLTASKEMFEGVEIVFDYAE